MNRLTFENLIIEVIPDIVYDKAVMLSPRLFCDMDDRFKLIKTHLYECYNGLFPQYRNRTVMSLHDAIISVTDNSDNSFIRLLELHKEVSPLSKVLDKDYLRRYNNLSIAADYAITARRNLIRLGLNDLSEELSDKLDKIIKKFERHEIITLNHLMSIVPKGLIDKLPKIKYMYGAYISQTGNRISFSPKVTLNFEDFDTISLEFDIESNKAYYNGRVSSTAEAILEKHIERGDGNMINILTV